MTPGTRMFTIPDMSPAYEADKEVEVIAFKEFQQGEPSATARYHWSLADIQKAVFVRLLEGPRKGKVSMMGEHDLIPKRRAT